MAIERYTENELGGENPEDHLRTNESINVDEKISR
jgi:hypothetical protein